MGTAKDLVFNALRILPRNRLSYLVGKIADIPLPPPFNSVVLKLFCALTGACAEDASRSISAYRSLADFFTRDLENGTPRDRGGVCLAGGWDVAKFRLLDSQGLPLIKGRTYTVGSLLGDEQLVGRFDNGAHFNLYLSPPDYHHVHAPVDGEIIRSTYVPGTLWPVNDWALDSIDDLFGKNERIVTYMQSPTVGLVAVVMVGATNVGKMSVTYDSFITNRWRRDKGCVPFKTTEYQTPIPIGKGERLGTFHLGSTVIVLTEKPIVSVRSPGKIRMGEQMATLEGD